jgi:hypothetical protein
MPGGDDLGQDGQADSEFAAEADADDETACQQHLVVDGGRADQPAERVHE